MKTKEERLLFGSEGNEENEEERRTVSGREIIRSDGSYRRA